MLQTETVDDAVEAMKIAFEGLQSSIQTCQPGIVISWDAADDTVSASVAIKGVTILPEGKNLVRSLLTIKPLQKCPVQRGCGGGFAATFPLVAGDEGLLVFSSRAIDSWWQNGGISAPIEDRMHHISDAFFIPGVNSVPRAIGSISTTSIRIGKKDQTAYFEVTTAGAVNIVAPGGCNINASSSTFEVTASGGITENNVTIDSSGNVGGIGTLDASGEGTFDGHTVGGHQHAVPGVNTGAPTHTVESDPPTG